jgi:hypothetical protein
MQSNRILTIVFYPIASFPTSGRACQELRAEIFKSDKPSPANITLVWRMLQTNASNKCFTPTLLAPQRGRQGGGQRKKTKGSTKTNRCSQPTKLHACFEPSAKSTRFLFKLLRKMAKNNHSSPDFKRDESVFVGSRHHPRPPSRQAVLHRGKRQTASSPLLMPCAVHPPLDRWLAAPSTRRVSAQTTAAAPRPPPAAAIPQS